MKRIEMIKGAKKMVDEFTNIKEGENVLIITDTQMPFSIAEVLAIACTERGAVPVITLMNPNPHGGMEPPPTVGEAMQKAQVMFIATSQGLMHSESRVRAARGGARGMQIVGLTEEDMFKGAIEANFLETRALGEKIGNVLREAKEVHVTNPAGTDIYLDFKGQGEKVRTFTNICHGPGQFGVMNLEVAISPNVGTAHGVIVCDASVTLFHGLLKDNIRVAVEKGRVTEITGGAEALRVANLLESLNDPMVYNVAELGISYNPMAKMTGVPVQDKGVYGACHIGIGSNITWGGSIKAATHFDFNLYSPTIVLNGKTILEKYRFNL